MDALWQADADHGENEPSLLIDVQGSKVRLIFCCIWREINVSIYPGFRYWHLPVGFVEQAQALRLELAADYLVIMAAWLAYLKSKLLIPSNRTKMVLRAKN